MSKNEESWEIRGVLNHSAEIIQIYGQELQQETHRSVSGCLFRMLSVLVPQMHYFSEITVLILEINLIFHFMVKNLQRSV